MQRYYGNWSTLTEMCDDFQIDEASLTDCDILFARYDTPEYEGYAFVVFRKDNVLYEVHGSHCSCNGLEGLWEAEATTIEALRMRDDAEMLTAVEAPA